MLNYYERAYKTIRDVLGGDVAVYVGDMFNPQSFNWFLARAEIQPAQSRGESVHWLIRGRDNSKAL